MKNRGKSPNSSFRSKKQKNQCVETAIHSMKKFTQGLKKNASLFQVPKKSNLSQKNQIVSSGALSYQQERQIWNENDFNSPLSPTLHPFHARQIKTSSLITSTQIPLRKTLSRKEQSKISSVDKKQKKQKNKVQQNLKTEQLIISSSISGSNLQKRRQKLQLTKKETNKDKNFFSESQIMQLKPVQLEKTKSYDEEIGNSILKQNIYLKQIINQYKQVLLAISYKYRHLQNKLIEKVHQDHLIDVLKHKINELENKNAKINQILQKQNNKVRNLQQNMKKSIEKIIEYYEPYRKIDFTLKRYLNYFISSNRKCQLAQKQKKVHENQVHQQYYNKQFENDQTQIQDKWDSQICASIEQFQRRYILEKDK